MNNDDDEPLNPEDPHTAEAKAAMKRRILVWMLPAALLLANPSPASATLKQGLSQLMRGQKDCKAKRFEQGYKLLLDSALTLQKANPQHKANRWWLPAARVCLRAWVLDVSWKCSRPDGLVGIAELKRIQKKIKYLAAPAVKRLIKSRLSICARLHAETMAKSCNRAPGRAGVTTLGKLEDTLAKYPFAKKALKVLVKGRKKCAALWLKDVVSRCQTNPGITELKEVGIAVGRVAANKRTKARKSYEACAQSIAQRAWGTCQSRRYTQGRTLLKQVITRYGFFKVGDKPFFRRLKTEWLPRCGQYTVDGWLKLRAAAGGVAYSLQVRVQVQLSRTAKPGQLLGELRASYAAINGQKQGCHVLVTPHDGRYSLIGTEKGGNIALKLQPKMPQTPAREETQVTCGEKIPVVAKRQLVHKLLSYAGLLAMRLKATHGHSQNFSWSGPLAKTVTGSLTGSVKLELLK